MRTICLTVFFLLCFYSNVQAAVSVDVCIRTPPVIVSPVIQTGYYETREQKVLVEPERYERIWVPAVYRYETDEEGNTIKVLVQKGYYKDVVIPANSEIRLVRVWVPAPVIVEPVIVERPSFLFSWHSGHHHSGRHHR